MSTPLQPNTKRHADFDPKCPACILERNNSRSTEATGMAEPAALLAVSAAVAGLIEPKDAKVLRDFARSEGTSAAVDLLGHMQVAESAASRHRFDSFGPEVWSKSSNPALIEFGRTIQWVAGHEAAQGRKFHSAAEAFAAYHRETGR